MATELKFISDMKEVHRDLAKLQKLFDKQTEKLSKMQDKSQQAKKGLKDMGKEGGDAASSISKVVGAWLSVGAAIGIASKALSFNNDLNVKSAELAKQSRFSLGALSQLAGGDPKEMTRMVDEAKKTSVESGIGLPMAAKLQFNLESLLIPELRKMFSDLVGTVEDPATLAEAAVTLQTAFGKKETGDVRNILNKALAASAVSKTTLEQMNIGLAQAASFLGPEGIKASDEEGFAAIAILSKARKSTEQAATEINALSAVLMEQGLSGQGLFKGLGAIRKTLQGKTDQQKLQFFGRKEAFKGYQTLMSQGPEVMAAFKSISASDAQDPANDNVARAIRVRQGDPLLGPTEENLKSERRLDLASLKRRAVGELTADKVIKDAMTLGEERGDSGYETFLKVFPMRAAKFFGFGAANVAGVGGAADFGGNLYRAPGAVADAFATGGALSNKFPTIPQPPPPPDDATYQERSNVPHYSQSEREGAPIFRIIADLLQKIDTNTKNMATNTEKTETNTRPNGGGGNVRLIPLSAGDENN